MLIVHIHITVKPTYIEEFKQATLENARHSILGPEIAQFELIQADEDPTSFVLVEA